MEERIARGLAALGLTPPPDAAPKLAEYGRLLLEQNQVMNLTAITEPDQVVDLHFLDCAALLTLGVDFRDKSLIDVGTGAGFPGRPLKFLEPSLRASASGGWRVSVKRFPLTMSPVSTPGRRNRPWRRASATALTW